MLPSKVLGIVILVSSVTAARAETDAFAKFSGSWGIKAPEQHSGEVVTFIKQGITLKAAMPDPLGNVSISRLSEAHGTADFVVSGEHSGAEFKCYYGLTSFSDKTMSWVLKDGSNKTCNELGNINWSKDP